MIDRYTFDPQIRKWIKRGLVGALVIISGILFSVIFIQGQIEHWKIALDAIKLVVIGILGACLSILIPRGFSEARDSFERSKEARTAFSHAKTGVDYLSLRLGILPLEEASDLIQRIHVWKHQAELYPKEIKSFLEYRRDQISPKQWADLLYEQLHAARDTLERNADAWDTMPVSRRIAELHAAQEAGIREWESYTGCKFPWSAAQPEIPADASDTNSVHS